MEISESKEHFKTFIESNEELKAIVNDIKYSYDLDLNIYLKETMKLI